MDPRLEQLLHARCPATALREEHTAGRLAHWLPEVDRLYGIPQPPLHHPEVDTGRHIELALDQARQLGADPATLLAVLLHDTGKARTDPTQWPRHHGHEELGLVPVTAVSVRCDVPPTWERLARHVAHYHLHAHRALELAPRTVARLLWQVDAQGRPADFERFLLACTADAQGRAGRAQAGYPQREFLRQAAQALPRPTAPHWHEAACSRIRRVRQNWAG